MTFVYLNLLFDYSSVILSSDNSCCDDGVERLVIAPIVCTFVLFNGNILLISIFICFLFRLLQAGHNSTTNSEASCSTWWFCLIFLVWEQLETSRFLHQTFDWFLLAASMLSCLQGILRNINYQVNRLLALAKNQKYHFWNNFRHGGGIFH